MNARGLRWRTAAAAGAVGVAVMLAVAPPAVARPQAARNSTPLPPHTSVYAPVTGAWIGAWVGPDPNLSAKDHYNEVLQFESMVKFKLALDTHYRSWTNTSWTEEAEDLAAGRIPFDAWSPAGKTTAAKIAAGDQDAVVRNVATALKGLGGPVLLRFGFEMDQSAHAFGSPSDFIAAWRHVYNVFKSAGATNVRFVWAPTASAFSNNQAIQYYPGDAYVDWIGVDGYNRYSTTGTWKSFGTIFTPFYKFGQAHPQPMIVAESGTTEDNAQAGRKGQWFLNAAAWLTTHTQIKAWMYDSSIGAQGYDNRVDSSVSSLAGYMQAGSEAYFQH